MGDFASSVVGRRLYSVLCDFGKVKCLSSFTDVHMTASFHCGGQDKATYFWFVFQVAIFYFLLTKAYQQQQPFIVMEDFWFSIPIFFKMMLSDLTGATLPSGLQGNQIWSLLSRPRRMDWPEARSLEQPQVYSWSALLQGELHRGFFSDHKHTNIQWMTFPDPLSLLFLWVGMNLLNSLFALCV